MLFNGINQSNQQKLWTQNDYDYIWVSMDLIWSVVGYTPNLLWEAQLYRISLRLSSLNPNWTRFDLFVDSIFELL